MRIQDLLENDNLEHKPTVSTEQRAAFNALADAQRGKPESAMLKAQDALAKRSDSSANAYGYAMEHVGDLTHRMSERYANPSTDWGLEYVAPKIRIGLRITTNPIDNDNISKFAPIPESIAYAQAHSQLPVYNDAQYHARQAAVALGKGDLSQSAQHLFKLKDLIDSGTFADVAGRYNPNYNR